MKIGVISDTHDRLEALGKAIQIFKRQGVGMMIHCGDWVSPFTLEYFDATCGEFRVPVVSVFGNKEGDVGQIVERNATLTNPVIFADKWTLELEIDRRRAVVFHGHDEVILQALIASGTYDVVFTGHTHTARNEVVGKTLVLNPGSTSYRRDGRRVDNASVAIYDSDDNSARIMQLD